MKIRSALSIIQRDMKHFGIICTIYDLVLRIVNRFLFFRVLRVIALSEITSDDLLPPQYRFSPIPIDELKTLSDNNEYGINPILIEEVQQGPNVCFGIYDGHTVANYFFVFVNPIRVRMTEHLEISFGSRYAYLCAAFTHANYRGLRMNSVGSLLAAKRYFSRGFKELLAYVESNNFSSLRSFQRVGWRTIGTVRIVRIFGRYFIQTESGCAERSFRVSARAS
jgi:hypothetical protein